MQAWFGKTLLAFVVAMMSPTAVSDVSQAELEPRLNQGNSKDGAALVRTLSGTMGKWGDYSCQTDYFNCTKGPKVTHSGAKYLYKDQQLRIEVKGGGYRDGSVLAKGKDGQIFVRGGPMLGFMKQKLDPDSRVLILADGNNVMQTDLPHLFSELKEEISRGCLCRLSNAPLQEPGLEATDVVEEFEPDQTTLKRRLYLNPGNHFPERVDIFKGGRRLSFILFSDYKVNSGLTDDIFQL